MQSKRSELDPDQHTAYFKKKAYDKYSMYRLVFEGGMSKAEVKVMDYDELDEAIAALNLHNKRVNDSMNEKPH